VFNKRQLGKIEDIEDNERNRKLKKMFLVDRFIICAAHEA